MRSVVALAVRRRVTVLMAMLAIAAFGVVGYQRLALDLLPDISYPSLTIQTELADTAPLEIENLVTRPIEEAVGVLRGLQSIHSVSRSGLSEITLEFDWDSDMNVLSMDLRDALDRLLLPEGTERPIVLRFDPSLDPILRLAFTGPGSLTELRRISDRKLKQELETVKGVAAAQVKGGEEEEIQIEIDQERLAALGIPLDRVRGIVGSSNVNLPGGLLDSADSQLMIRLVNEYQTVEEIGELIVSQGTGLESGSAVTGAAARGLVRLRDVAEVRRGTKKREEITRYNGRECIEIAVYKEGDANTVSAARRVREEIADLQGDLPAEHEISVLFDQSRFIERALTEVRGAALLGGLLAIVVLLLFLRDLRSTLIIATSIPLSIVATFIAMYRLDISLNIMSLGGLTLGIGMLVDNSIVVLESIFRRRSHGVSLARAAVEGTTEVGAAVVASTLTTVAVFLPIVFVEGIAGQLFGDMSLTVTASLLASLVVAITVIPMLAALERNRGTTARRAADEGPARPVSGRSRWARAFRGSPPEPGSTAPLGPLARRYDTLLRAAIARRTPVLGVSFALFALALLAVPRLPTELIPSINEGEFFFEVKMPDGTPLAATDRVLQRLEEAASKETAFEGHYSTVGSRLVSGGLSLNNKAENLGQLNLVMKDRGDEADLERTMRELREVYGTIPDLEIKSGKPTYFSLKTPVELIVFGENLDELRQYSLELQRRVTGIPGLVDVRSSLEAGSPELRVHFDRGRVAAMGLDMRTLSETLRDRIHGDVPTRFKEEDRQLDIRVRNREADRATVQDIRNLVVPGPNGEPIRLLTVADIVEDRGPAEIHRLQQQRAAVLTANLQGRSLGDAVADVEAAIAGYPPPRGLSIEIGGQNQEMQVSFGSLRFAIGLAIFLVYLVMAATFESLLHPFLVLFTIPLALIGVVAGLGLTGTPISVIVLIGTIMLVGIVVNNAIVLIDAINQLRRAGLEKLEAVVQAGHLRMRPILMTTSTTVLGLLPMALSVGEGAELRSPLAITVCAGLSFSTLLTLVVIPAAYMLVPSTVRAPEEDEVLAPSGLRPAGAAPIS